ncbi:DUF2254 domain-containing protein [Actinospongicola halichondriae]|uniref:DUF2254 domain-containing protein n=1 Tax=Actinospongicola halichondriae TaxID=3236844 RepID=UPI003D3E9EC7
MKPSLSADSLPSPPTAMTPRGAHWVMVVRLSALAERLRSSLFFVPMAFVVFGLLLGLAGLEVDTRITEGGTELPDEMTSTVDSARAVLTTVAGATITFAGIAFSVSLLLIQQASSQYSPRVIHGFFRDPFNKRVMGVVVGTFTFCLVVLRSVRSALEQDGSPVIPNLSVALAVALGVVSILSIIAFISHSAHAMDVSKILQDVSDDATVRVERLWNEPADGSADETEPTRPDIDDDDVLDVDVATSGWIQQIDFERIASAAGSGHARLHVAVGRYAVPGTPLCTISPSPEDADEARDIVRGALVVGDARTAQQDVTYGVRQLADVALKALSPGVNDPTTAQDAIFHLGGVVRELLRRDPPPAMRKVGDCHIEVSEDATHADVVALAFDEIRLAANGLPTVCIYLLEVLDLLDEALRDRPSEVTQGLRDQASLVRDGAAIATLLDHDRRRIEDAYDARFG